MANVYEVVTNRILEMLEKGVVPWAKPWRVSTGAPRSLVSGKHYRGINVLLTGSQYFESPYWLTFKQANELGATIRPDERGTPIIFWTKMKAKDKESGEEKEVPMARYYTVFNVAQTDSLKVRRELLYPAPQAGTADPLESAERIAAAYLNGPEVRLGYSKAAYSPASDRITLLRREAFSCPEEFYSTLFHELVHSTGHEKRLNRESLRKVTRFGDHEYSREELVAEIGSAMLCQQAHISDRVIENQAAYIGGWLRVLRSDSRAVVVAAGQAQKAADWITGHVTPPNGSAMPEHVTKEATTD